MKKYVMIMMALLVSVSVLTACQKDQSGKTADDGQKTGQVEITQTDLTGSWQDEVSQRATMDATKKDDGSYDIVVSWGSSASEKSTWEIHGGFRVKLSTADGQMAQWGFLYVVERLNDGGGVNQH